MRPADALGSAEIVSGGGIGTRGEQRPKRAPSSR
jgi:hypothetical protein